MVLYKYMQNTCGVKPSVSPLASLNPTQWNAALGNVAVNESFNAKLCNRENKSVPQQIRSHEIHQHELCV